MTNAANFDSRLDIALKQYKGDKANEKDLREALNLLIYRIHSITGYTPSNQALTGQIYLVRPTGSNKYDDCGLSKVKI